MLTVDLLELPEQLRVLCHALAVGVFHVVQLEVALGQAFVDIAQLGLEDLLVLFGRCLMRTKNVNEGML